AVVHRLEPRRLLHRHAARHHRRLDGLRLDSVGGSACSPAAGPAPPWRRPGDGGRRAATAAGEYHPGRPDRCARHHPSAAAELHPVGPVPPLAGPEPGPRARRLPAGPGRRGRRGHPGSSPGSSSQPGTLASGSQSRSRTTVGPTGVEASTATSVIVAGSATLDGLSYQGTAQVPTASGTLTMMKFTMSSLTLAGDVRATVTQNGQ